MFDATSQNLINWFVDAHANMLQLLIRGTRNVFDLIWLKTMTKAGLDGQTPILPDEIPAYRLEKVAILHDYHKGIREKDWQVSLGVVCQRLADGSWMTVDIHDSFPHTVPFFSYRPNFSTPNQTDPGGVGHWEYHEGNLYFGHISNYGSTSPKMYRIYVTQGSERELIWEAEVNSEPEWHIQPIKSGQYGQSTLAITKVDGASRTLEVLSPDGNWQTTVVKKWGEFCVGARGEVAYQDQADTNLVTIKHGTESKTIRLPQGVKRWETVGWPVGDYSALLVEIGSQIIHYSENGQVPLYQKLFDASEHGWRVNNGQLYVCRAGVIYLVIEDRIKFR